MTVRGRKSGDQVLAVALASGLTVEAAARQANVAPRTVYRRLGDPDFLREVDTLRADMVGQALGRLTESMTAAADTLRALLAARGESVRLGAARSILELPLRLREAAELAQRVRDLEGRLNAGEEQLP
jgi:hypothetical protein